MTKLSKLVAERVLGWQFISAGSNLMFGSVPAEVSNTNLGWFFDNQVVAPATFNPEQNWIDCEVVLRYLTRTLNLEVTILVDSEDEDYVNKPTEEYRVLLNYKDVDANSIHLSQAICIAAIKAILEPERFIAKMYVSKYLLLLDSLKIKSKE